MICGRIASQTDRDNPLGGAAGATAQLKFGNAGAGVMFGIVDMQWYLQAIAHQSPHQ